MGRKIDRTQVAAWVLKGNPDIWDYFGALDDEDVEPGELIVGSWTVGTTYRSDLMRRGDRMVLWITGNDNPGIYEVGRLTGDVRRAHGMNSTYARDVVKASSAEWAVPYWSVRLRKSIGKSDLQADPILAGSEHFSSPRMPNPTYLDHEQWDALWVLAAAQMSQGSRDLISEWDQIR